MRTILPGVFEHVNPRPARSAPDRPRWPTPSAPADPTRLVQAFRRRVAPLGLTPDRFTALRWLHEREAADPDPPLTQRQLTALMSSDANTITSLLARMEKQGLVRRRCDPRDRRMKRVVLTPAGRRAFERARPIATELQERVLEAVPASRREAFLRDLEAVADAAHAALHETRPTDKTNKP